MQQFSNTSDMCLQGGVQQFSNTSDMCLQGGVQQFSNTSDMCLQGGVQQFSNTSDMCLQGGVQQLTSHMVQVIGKKNVRLNQAVSHIVQVRLILEALVWFLLSNVAPRHVRGL